MSTMNEPQIINGELDIEKYQVGKHKRLMHQASVIRVWEDGVPTEVKNRHRKPGQPVAEGCVLVRGEEDACSVS